MLPTIGTKRVLKTGQLTVAPVNTVILLLIANGKLGHRQLVRATGDLGSIGVKIWVTSSRKRASLIDVGKD